MEKGVTVITVDMTNANYGALTVNDNPSSFYK